MAVATNHTDEFRISEDEYHSSFDLFSRNRSKQQQLWVSKEFIPRFLKNLKSDFSGESFNVLGVGSSNGQVDFLFMKELLKLRSSNSGFKPIKICWTVIEPNEVSINEFKRKVEDFSERDLFEFTWIKKTFEEYLESRNNKDTKFNLVHFINVFYYMHEEKVINKTFEELLAPNGQILAVVGTEGDIWTRMMANFRSKIKTLETELHYPLNTMICKLADQNGWKCESFIGKYDLEITEMFIDGDENGIKLLQFFLHAKENPFKLYDADLMRELVDFFKRESNSKVVGDQTRVFVSDDDGVVILTK